MAYDPHRDLVPVRDSSNRFCRGSNDKFDYQILGKLSRSDLEDRFLRLLDEQTQLKKLVNGQDEKIKRLGTKLLRLINEKKVGKKNLDQNKETEDLHIRVIELEHENYALKDKNILLKQQLASQSAGHIPYHRSPARSNHTSPLMSVRQTPANPSEVGYDSAIEKKSNAAELKLLEAKACIQKLNNEIKALHSKIEYMQESFEKNSLDNRKSRVMENIEIIRLQRSLKQQEIQIVALQAQVKNSENNQQLLKEELAKAHIENDDAINVISEKQAEILTLCSKLDEKKLSRLEENELKERINDLLAERDSLKKRSDLLMQTIGEKTEDTDQVKELKMLLIEERCKKEKAENALEMLQRSYQNLKDRFKDCDCQEGKGNSQASLISKEDPGRVKFEDTQESNPQEGPLQETENLNVIDYDGVRRQSTCCPCPQNYFSNPEYWNHTGAADDEENPNFQTTEGNYYVQNVRLEHELQYLREMLRTQTARVEAQQSEISRLMYELQVNEEKCNSTLQKLDSHLKVIQRLGFKRRKDGVSSIDSNKVPDSFKTNEYTKMSEKSSEEKFGVPEKEPAIESEITVIREETKSPQSYRDIGSPKRFSFGFHSLEKERETVDKDSTPEPSKNGTYDGERRNTEPTAKKRFVEQVFLESSDETDYEEKVEHPSFANKFSFQRDDFDSQTAFKNRRLREEMEDSTFLKDGASKKKNIDVTENPSPNSSLYDNTNLISEPLKDHKRAVRKVIHKNTEPEQVMVNILWLKPNQHASLWKDERIKLIFVDFCFLDIKGEETETPESLRKPEKLGEKFNFHFSKTINISESNKKTLQAMINNYDLDLITFKVVSEPEDFNGDLECEDIGVATITVREFLENRGLDFFQIQVKNLKNTKEMLGKLAVSVDATPGIFRNN